MGWSCGGEGVHIFHLLNPDCETIFSIIVSLIIENIKSILRAFIFYISVYLSPKNYFLYLNFQIDFVCENYF